ncbi:hypothetical protein PG997_004028 [Apiospora hydei]|uniref:F-box domain-containing protein n=1 Tax=Apiospora hydei TaxID=1337664 RepID=A0ABR1X0Y2_9PEZI
MASSTSLLLTMPLEVLLSISHYLTTPDYCNLRRSCKHIEASLHSSFAKEYFSKRQFILTEFSLKALVDISRSKFSPYLTHVILAAERPVWRRPHAFAAVDSTSEATRRLRMRQEYSSHINLINFSQDLEMLADAFAHLPNLETIGIRDFNSRSRFRDHPLVEWRSYGANTYQRDTGLALARPDTTPVFGHMSPQLALDNNWPWYEARLFGGLLQALGKSGSKPKGFEVILRNIGLFDVAFNLPRFFEPFTDPVLARLETLFLDLSDDQIPAMTRSGSDQTPSDCTNYFLRTFLLKLPALSSLRLNFAKRDHHRTCDFLSWLASPLPLPAVAASTTATLAGSIQRTETDADADASVDLSPPPPVVFSALKQLDLGKALISIDVLTDLVNKYKGSLQGLSFYDVTLMGPDASGSSGSGSGRVNLWAKALRHFIKSDVALKSLRVDRLSQDHGPSLQTLLVRFNDTARSRIWRGQDKENGLKEMANSMVIDWPGSEDESMDGSDEMGSDEDSDNDDDEDDDDDGE